MRKGKLKNWLLTRMRSCQFEHEVMRVPTREMDEIDSPPPLPGPIQGFMYTIRNPDNTRCVTLKSSQLQQVLAKIFGYFPDTVFLISENGQVYSSLVIFQTMILLVLVKVLFHPSKILVKRIVFNLLYITATSTFVHSFKGL